MSGRVVSVLDTQPWIATVFVRWCIDGGVWSDRLGAMDDEEIASLRDKFAEIAPAEHVEAAGGWHATCLIIDWLSVRARGACRAPEAVNGIGRAESHAARDYVECPNDEALEIADPTVCVDTCEKLHARHLIADLT